MNVRRMHYRFLAAGLALAPVMPFLYAQGRFVRYRVGRLPDARGRTTGEIGEGADPVKVVAIGESTIAGVGAQTLDAALAGQFAKHLSARLERPVIWHAVGQSGITIERTLDELVPRLPSTDADIILVALGGNDVFNLSSPLRWRFNLMRLIRVLRSRYPTAKVYFANVPMVRDFLALPNPLRYLLSRLAKAHHFNAINVISRFDEAIYFDDIKKVPDEFFSDGIHPSEIGYDNWSEAMVDFLLARTKIR